MKTTIITLISIFAVCFSLKSQNSIDAAVSAIITNNTTLAAQRKQADAEKIQNRTGIFLQNPEAGFNYLWGNDNLVGNRIDINFKQTFDFPTSYKYKSNIADALNGQADLAYQKQLKSVALIAQEICIDIVYANILKAEYSKRLLYAQSLANSFKVKYNAGEISILEYNKSQLNLLSAQKEYELLDIERAALLSELAALNGGIALSVNDTTFAVKTISTDFEQWYLNAAEANPELKWLKQQNEICAMQEKLNSALALPKFSTGYMSEKNIGQQFQGISIGISIPLWENKNTVKYAKANTLAYQSLEADRKIAFYNKLKTLHQKAVSLQKAAETYRTTLKAVNNYDLLKKALDKGEISLIDLLMEISFYYSNIKNMMETERDLQKVIAELKLYE